MHLQVNDIFKKNEMQICIIEKKEGDMANNQSWKGLGLPTGWPFSGMADTDPVPTELHYSSSSFFFFTEDLETCKKLL